MKTVMSSLDSLASASSCAVTFAASRWLIDPLMITVRASLHLDEDDALDVSSAEPVEDYKIDRGAQKPGVLRVELEPGQQRHELLVHLSGRYGLAPQHRVEAHHARVPRLPQEEAQQDRDGADKQQEDERECHGRCRSQVREMSRAGIEPAACGLKVRCSTN